MFEFVNETYNLDANQTKFLEQVKEHPSFNKVAEVYVNVSNPRYFYFKLKPNMYMKTKEECGFSIQDDYYSILNMEDQMDSDDPTYYVARCY